MTIADDRELVARAVAGDADAFEALIRRHSGRVYRLLARLLGNSASAEDVTQETFVRAWRALPSFRGDAMFSTWLYRIAANEANRLLAREARRRELPIDDAMEDIPDLGAEPSAAAEIDDLQAHLERCVAELPPDYRAAVVLRDVEGLTNEEAAEALGIGVRNFKSRLHRGRMAVRRRLEETYGSP